MQPNAADYAEWLDLPVTQYVMAALDKMAKAQFDLWAQDAWNGNLESSFHQEAHVRADCYKAMRECTLDDWRAVNDPDA